MTFRDRSTLLLIVSVACWTSLAGFAQAAKDETKLVSRQSPGISACPIVSPCNPDIGLAADGDSHGTAISADGRYVAFTSDADNLSSTDDNSVANIFVRDNQTGNVRLVTRQSAAAGGAGASGSSYYPAISADGRYVAFTSDADNLSTADNNAYYNVFVRDTQAATTTLVSRQSAADGGAGADGPSFHLAISADGRYVAFDSHSDNLSTADNNNSNNVFVRDTQAATTTLVSRQSAADGGAGGNDYSYDPAISANGRYVAFYSEADNLSTADNNAYSNVFVRDTQAALTTLVSRQSAGADGTSSDPAISANGRYVAFTSTADNLSTADNNAYSNVFVRDTDPKAATTTLVSRQSAADGGAAANEYSYAPAISADGRYVAFDSHAFNLLPPDNLIDLNFWNVFVRDTQAATTTLVSRQSAADGGATALAPADDPAISADGRYVAFSSTADNLSKADNNAYSNIFLRDVLGGP